MYKIAVCDDEKIYRSRLKDLLENTPSPRACTLRYSALRMRTSCCSTIPRTSTSYSWT